MERAGATAPTTSTAATTLTRATAAVTAVRVRAAVTATPPTTRSATAATATAAVSCSKTDVQIAQGGKIFLNYFSPFRELQPSNYTTSLPPEGGGKGGGVVGRTWGGSLTDSGDDGGGVGEEGPSTTILIDPRLRQLLGTNPNISDNKLLKSWQYVFWMWAYCVVCATVGILSVTLLPDPDTLATLREGGEDDQLMDTAAQSLGGAYDSYEGGSTERPAGEPSYAAPMRYPGSPEVNPMGYGGSFESTNHMGYGNQMDSIENMIHMGYSGSGSSYPSKGNHQKSYGGKQLNYGDHTNQVRQTKQMFGYETTTDTSDENGALRDSSAGYGRKPGMRYRDSDNSKGERDSIGYAAPSTEVSSYSSIEAHESSENGGSYTTEKDKYKSDEGYSEEEKVPEGVSEHWKWYDKLLEIYNKKKDELADKLTSQEESDSKQPMAYQIYIPHHMLPEYLRQRQKYGPQMVVVNQKPKQQYHQQQQQAYGSTEEPSDEYGPPQQQRRPSPAYGALEASSNEYPQRQRPKKQQYQQDSNEHPEDSTESNGYGPPDDRPTMSYGDDSGSQDGDSNGYAAPSESSSYSSVEDDADQYGASTEKSKYAEPEEATPPPDVSIHWEWYDKLLEIYNKKKETLADKLTSDEGEEDYHEEGYSRRPETHQVYIPHEMLPPYLQQYHAYTQQQEDPRKRKKQKGGSGYRPAPVYHHLHHSQSSDELNHQHYHQQQQQGSDERRKPRPHQGYRPTKTHFQTIRDGSSSSSSSSDPAAASVESSYTSYEQRRRG